MTAPPERPQVFLWRCGGRSLEAETAPQIVVSRAESTTLLQGYRIDGAISDKSRSMLSKDRSMFLPNAVTCNQFYASTDNQWHYPVF